MLMAVCGTIYVKTGLVQVLEPYKVLDFEMSFQGHLKLLEIGHFSWKIDQTP